MAGSGVVITVGVGDTVGSGVVITVDAGCGVIVGVGVGAIVSFSPIHPANSTAKNNAASITNFSFI